MNRSTKLTVGGIAAVAALTAVLAVTGTSSSKPGVFYSICNYRDSKPDDPIVFPQQPGASHLHDFAGRRIDAFSQPSQAPDQETTCDVPGDSAGYWFPALYVDGLKHDPVVIQARYSTGGKPVDTLQAFPPGLKVVAGPNAKYAKPGCRPGTSTTAPLGCKKQGSLVVQFPDCVAKDADGSPVLDSVDHRSHMAYSMRGVCPVTHPVPVPSITMKALYENLPSSGVVTLASGSMATLHADFFNSWDQDRLNELVETCIRYPTVRGKKCTALSEEP